MEAETDDLVAAVFAKHGNMYFTGRESQLVLQPVINAFLVKPPAILQVGQGLVGLYAFAANGFIGKPPHRAVAVAGMCLDISVTGRPPPAHIKPGVF